MTQANPYTPPVVDEPCPDEELYKDVDIEQELAVTRVEPLTKVAISSVAVTGALLLTGALQLWMATRLRGGLALVPWGMLLLGVTQMVLAAKIYRLRYWAALTATVVCGVLCIAGGAWFLLTVASGFISFIALLLPLASLAAAILAGLAIPACKRATEARRRLAAGGLDVDF